MMFDPASSPRKVAIKRPGTPTSTTSSDYSDPLSSPEASLSSSPLAPALPPHVRRDVLTLATNFCLEQQGSETPWRPLRQVGEKCTAGDRLPPLRETIRGPTLGKGLKRSCRPAKHAGQGQPSFEAVLRIFYPLASAEDLDAMLSCAAPVIEEEREAHKLRAELGWNPSYIPRPVGTRTSTTTGRPLVGYSRVFPAEPACVPKSSALAGRAHSVWQHSVAVGGAGRGAWPLPSYPAGKPAASIRLLAPTPR